MVELVEMSRNINKRGILTKKPSEEGTGLGQGVA
jgi:hypothetical protein